MALTKSLPSSFGIPATYWKINPEFSINVSGKSCFIRVEGYLDKDSRDAGSTPISSRGFSLFNVPAVTEVKDQNGVVITSAADAQPNFDTYLSDHPANEPRPGIYDFVKNQPEFDGATDI